MKKFTILEEETGMHSLPVLFVRACLKHDKIIGQAVRSAFFYIKEGHFKWCYRLDEIVMVGRAIFKRILRDARFSKKISLAIKALSRRLHNFSKKTREIDLSKKDNKFLAKTYQQYGQILEELYFWGALIEIMEVYHNLFSGFLEKKLAKVINQKSLNKSPGECLAILTIPAEESFAKKQEKDFLKLVSQINRNSRLKRLFQDKSAKAIIKKLVGNSFNKKIDQHIIGYCWVNYNYEGPAMDKEFLVDLLKNALKVFSPEQKIKEIESRDKEKIQKQSQLMQDLKPDKFLRRSIKLAKEFVALKSLRKESIFHASYASDKTRSEASRRLKISLNQCRSMLPEELIKALEFGQINRAELRAREKEVAYICDDGREKIYTGGQARKLSQQLIIQEKVKEVSQIQGTVASPGQASGLVKIIRHVKDMSKMHPGDILVAMATNPNFVPAMKKAAAIVTDMGGLTCHAAIVSRELSVPCVVGTKFATKVLKDGDMVEVDAEKGIIRILK